jgi:hypothetical protein
MTSNWKIGEFDIDSGEMRGLLWFTVWHGVDSKISLEPTDNKYMIVPNFAVRGNTLRIHYNKRYTVIVDDTARINKSIFEQLPQVSIFCEYAHNLKITELINSEV